MSTEPESIVKIANKYGRKIRIEKLSSTTLRSDVNDEVRKLIGCKTDPWETGFTNGTIGPYVWRAKVGKSKEWSYGRGLLETLKKAFENIEDEL